MAAPEQMTIITPPRGWAPPRLRELWEFRDLLYVLTWRDVKVRYKQTLVGAGWAILQPLFAVLTFSVVFGRLVHVQSDEAPYAVFVFCALAPWMFMAASV